MATMIVEGVAPQRATHPIYYAVHKGIRHAHGRILDRIASLDLEDRDAVAGLGQAMEEHLAMCRCHLSQENARIHAVLETRAPGASGTAAHQHEGHESAFAELEALTRRLIEADPEAAPAARRALYRRFALMMAEDFEHMDGEEYELEPILQQCFTNAELEQITRDIVGSIAPREMTTYSRAMLGAASPDERAAMLTNMKAGMPEGAFGPYIEKVLGQPWQWGDWRAFDRL